MSRVPDATLQGHLWVRDGLGYYFHPHIILDEFVAHPLHLELIEYVQPLMQERNWTVVLYQWDGEVVRRRFATLEHAVNCFWYSQNNMAAKLLMGILEGVPLMDLVGEDGVEYAQPS